MTPEDNSFFPKRKRRAASGGTRTRNVLRSRQTLYQHVHPIQHVHVHTYSSCAWFKHLVLTFLLSSFLSRSDRLGELERDKARLSEQLIAQQREHLVREMDILKKSKSKNLLKKGFKKLKGKIQVRSSSAL